MSVEKDRNIKISEKRTKKYSLYLTESEYRYLDQVATERYLSIGTFIKSVLLEALATHPQLQNEKNPFYKAKQMRLARVDANKKAKKQ